MATIHPFPPRRASLAPHYPALVEYATPADIRRKLPDEAPDLYDSLADAGYPLTLRDRLALVDWPTFAGGFVCGAIAWTVLCILPFAAGWL